MEMLLLIPLTAAAALLYWLLKPPSAPEGTVPLEHPALLSAPAPDAENLPGVVTVHAAPIPANHTSGE